ncbi:hypothetical protein ANRL2_03433, partial [Anaerolineae bacterium]
VLGSTKSAVWKFIRKSYSDALAVEMEGHGFLQAAFASKVDAIVIRGISDLIEGKFEADAKGWQEIAARHAAAFAFEVLAKLESATSPSSSPAVPPKPKSVEATHAANSPQPNVFPVRNLPYRQNPNFTGREDLLTKLRDALVSGKPAAVVQAIGGLGGVGKTQLALEYAYRHLGDYNVIWWVRAEHATTLASDYASLAGKLGLPGDTIADQNLVVGIVRRWLEKEKNWLLIFDNAAEPSHIEPYLPETVGGHVIITSRHLDWSTLASPLPIETFTPEEALQFLLERTQQHDADAATELAGELGYLPLALEQARAYMESTGRTLADYLELFKAHQLEVLSRGASSSDYPYTVATTWELSFKRVADDSPASVDLLNLCAFLAPEDIPLQVLIDGARFLSEQFATAVQDPFRLDDAVKALLQYSLISRGQDSLAIHRLVRVVVREKMAVEVRRSWVTSAVTLINDAFQFDIDDPKTWPRSARLLSHALTAAQHAEDLQVAGEATGHLLNQTGRYLTTRGEYIDSEREFRRALALRVTVLGENHPDTAESLNDLGWAISKQGNN